MADAPTQQDLFLAGRAEAILSPTRFDRAIIDTEGSDVNTVFRVAATMGEEAGRYLQTALNDLSLSTAKGIALDRRVFDLYQLRRIEATNAVVTLQLSRAGTNGFTVAAGSTFGTATGVVFRTTTDVAFGNGVLGPISVLATAVQTGPSGNVAAGTITQVQTAQEDSTLVVANAEAAAGGRERESDDELLTRARAFFVTARRGTKAAIEFGALETPGVAQATAEEVFQSVADGALPGYRVSLNVADPNGQANAALATAVQQSLGEYRALGVPVLVVPAIPQYVTITVSGLLFAAGANTAAVVQQATNALLSIVNTLQPGAVLRRADLYAALQGVPQLVVPDGAISEPAGDLVPSLGTVIRTTRDRITLTG